jgi:hypothetical protein
MRSGDLKNLSKRKKTKTSRRLNDDGFFAKWGEGIEEKRVLIMFVVIEFVFIGIGRNRLLFASMQNVYVCELCLCTDRAGDWWTG